jgi:hypothetical protein
VSADDPADAGFASLLSSLQEMELALSALLAEFGFDLEVLDVDADPALEASYDELGPGAPARRQGALPLLPRGQQSP